MACLCVAGLDVEEGWEGQMEGTQDITSSLASRGSTWVTQSVLGALEPHSCLRHLP